MLHDENVILIKELRDFGKSLISNCIFFFFFLLYFTKQELIKREKQGKRKKESVSENTK